MNKQKFTKMVRTYITLTHKWWKRAILQYIRRLKARKNTITVCYCIKSLNKFMLTINNNWKSSVKVINLVLIYLSNKFCSIFPLILMLSPNELSGSGEWLVKRLSFCRRRRPHWWLCDYAFVILLMVLAFPQQLSHLPEQCISWQVPSAKNNK